MHKNVLFAVDEKTADVIVNIAYSRNGNDCTKINQREGDTIAHIYD